VHRRLDSFDPDASMKAWIFGIARRVASHYRRTAQRNARKLAALSIGDQRRSDQPIGRREMALTMETFLGRLDECKRIAFVLSELEGWSAPEIARVAGTNANTIYSRIRMAKQQLRDHFAAADAEAYVEQAIEAVKLATRPPRGAAKHCWIGIVPELASSSATTATTTGLGATLAKLKFVALGAVAGSMGLVGVDAALPEAPTVVRTAAPVELRATQEVVERRAPASTERAVAAPPVATPVVPDVPVQMPATAPPVGSPRAKRVDPVDTRAQPKRERVEPSRSPAAPAAVDGLDDAETSILAEAQKSLKAGEPARALDLVREHARRFPSSRLGDLLGVTEVEALCAAGRGDAARNRAAEISAKNPDSSAAKRVRDVCKK
jgi:RNA polymerase sigma factor (sigma-70 family)